MTNDGPPTRTGRPPASILSRLRRFARIQGPGFVLGIVSGVMVALLVSWEAVVAFLSVHQNFERAMFALIGLGVSMVVGIVLQVEEDVKLLRDRVAGTEKSTPNRGDASEMDNDISPGDDRRQ